MSTSVAQFLEQLRSTGLASEDELRALEQSELAADRAADAEPLAQRLVRDKKITLFQATQLYRGRGAGLVLGNYLVLEKLGQGGMGIVYKARHRVMDRVVALKLLPAALAKDEQAMRRFQREVRAAAQLVHPNVVTAYDADQSQNSLYLVMEFVDGQDLSTLVRQRGQLPVAEAVDFTLQAAKGLEYAHAMGVVHRDIKPGNLLLSRDGVVKILDLGLARCTLTPLGAAAVDDDLTRSGQVLGTVDYMAPEQGYATRDADQRSDIYSLGCTLYRLLTGEPPYVAESVVQRVMAHRDAPVPRLSDRRGDVPPRLDALCQRMMAKQPDARPQTMREVVAELALIAGELSSPPSLQDERRLQEELLDAGPLGANPLAAGPLVPGPAADTRITFVPAAGQSGGQAGIAGPRAGATVPTFAPTFGEPAATKQPSGPIGPRAKWLWLAGGALTLVVLLAGGWRWLHPPAPADNRLVGAGDADPSASQNVTETPGKTLPRKGKLKAKITSKAALAQKRVLIVVPRENFWIPDFVPVVEGLTAAGVNVQVASSQRAPAVGAGRPEGMQVTPDLTVAEAVKRFAEFDAVCFAGKSADHGPNEFAADGEQAGVTRQLLEEMRSGDRIIAGLCRGTVVLRDAGVLAGRRAARGNYVETRRNDQVSWARGEPVVRDGQILTGANPPDAAAFTQRLIEMLSER